MYFCAFFNFQKSDHIPKKAPSLETIMESDGYLQNIIQKIKVSLPFTLSSIPVLVRHCFMCVICYPLRNQSNVPLMQQKYIHTRLSVSDFSIRRMTLWIWTRCDNRIMVMYNVLTQSLFSCNTSPSHNTKKTCGFDFVDRCNQQLWCFHVFY